MVERVLRYAIFEILKLRKKQAQKYRSKFIREAEYDITHCDLSVSGLLKGHSARPANGGRGSGSLATRRQVSSR
jgi:hypothetical protein